MAPPRRIAVTLAGGYVPGLNAVLTGVVRAAGVLGWEVVGIRDGFEGLLSPDRYPAGGTFSLTREAVEDLAGAPGAALGSGLRTDPFHVRIVDEDFGVQEVDRSDAVLASLQAQAVDTVIAVVDPGTFGIVWKLHRKGLRVVCVPESVENDVAATLLSFGFNSALSFTTDVLERAGQAARSAHRIGVVEVLGTHAGWLALQAGTAACADAVLIPEIPYDLAKVAATLRETISAGRPHGLVVVAQGARPASGAPSAVESSAAHPLKASLSPGATGPAGAHVIEPAGHAAETVARELQRLANHQTYPLVLGQLVKGGPPTAVDRQLGLAYGAGAVRAVAAGQAGVMVAFNPPDVAFVPLAEVLNKVRTVPPASVFVQTARALGIALGD